MLIITNEDPDAVDDLLERLRKVTRQDEAGEDPEPAP
jgi:hypothetical protein